MAKDRPPSPACWRTPGSARRGSRCRRRSAGRAGAWPDALFEHDGQITKREVRAITISALAPRRGELLWDVGAGAGSVAIEWMLRDAPLRGIGGQRNEDAVTRTTR